MTFPLKIMNNMFLRYYILWSGLPPRTLQYMDVYYTPTKFSSRFSRWHTKLSGIFFYNYLPYMLMR